MLPGVVKYQVGLRMALAGYRKLEDAAAAIGISPQYLANILAGRDRPAKHQQALADLCGCRPVELFGPFTHPSLRGRSEGSTPTRIKKERRA